MTSPPSKAEDFDALLLVTWLECHEGEYIEVLEKEITTILCRGDKEFKQFAELETIVEELQALLPEYGDRAVEALLWAEVVIGSFFEE